MAQGHRRPDHDPKVVDKALTAWQVLVLTGSDALVVAQLSVNVSVSSATRHHRAKEPMGRDHTACFILGTQLPAVAASVRGSYPGILADSWKYGPGHDP